MKKVPALKWEVQVVPLGTGVKIYLTSALNENEWSGSRTPGEKAPSTYWIGGCAKPRVGLKEKREEKNFCPSQ
jgi:hypothetical protein